MVRLKVYCAVTQQRVKRVSIPYGTIKRTKHNYTDPNTTVFQFLMVRLKDCTLCRKHKVSQVSIPYGTIKRPLTRHSL